MSTIRKLSRADELGGLRVEERVVHGQRVPVTICPTRVCVGAAMSCYDAIPKHPSQGSYSSVSGLITVVRIDEEPAAAKRRRVKRAMVRAAVTAALRTVGGRA